MLSKFLRLSFFILVLSSCASSDEKLVNKAEQEALEQKSQLAKYLFIQVVQNHKEKDSIRFRALKGLANVSMTQLYDYATAAKAFNVLFEEYSQVSAYKDDISNLRLMASRLFRMNLQEPSRSLDIMTPLMTNASFTVDWGHELGRVYLALRNFEQAEHWLEQSWSMAKGQSDCKSLRELQLDLIQVFSLQENCGEALKWANQSFPGTCRADEFAVTIEKAHCYEIQGEVPKAQQLYEDLIRRDPENTRAHFFLESLKKRQKEKQQK